ncbi:vWA domain-containing protein [Rhizobium sp. LjRoot254]|uniref:vWA domain-containing protein n=1 Tax=Rhizobium sp. LjRoot254 TaxID=3342297 RepID=UPI003ECFF72A
MFARAADAFKNGIKTIGRRFVTDRAGNLAMSFAIVSIPLLGAMGASFDYVRALNLHREIESNLDAALVAAVTDIDAKDDTAIKAQLANWLAAEAQITDSYELDTASIVIDRTSQGITAKVNGNVATTFLRVLGWDNVPVSVQASVIGGGVSSEEENKAQSSFSMYFVLDRSGSMDEYTTTSYTTTCYRTNKAKTPYTCTKLYKKMEALKLASASLLSQILLADPESQYSRTGGVSYNNVMQSPTPLAWGTSAVSSYITNLTSTGTTNSGEAFQKAYESLMVEGTDSEEKAHEMKNGNKTPTKFILFMTDGENNVSGADAKTKKYCDNARTDGIRVFSIAFMAPVAGQNLLRYCATNPADYFNADSTAELVAAFTSIGKSASKTLIRLTN